jgi:hypothetical protein
MDKVRMRGGKNKGEEKMERRGKGKKRRKNAGKGNVDFLQSQSNW